jgi:integration host factor subunit alpha
MLKIRKNQLTKKDISKKINSIIGFSNLYSKEITNDLIDILKDLIKIKEAKIKNFGSFRVIKKNQRIGRNPKNKKKYIIEARKSLSFYISKKIDNKLKDF